MLLQPKDTTADGSKDNDVEQTGSSKPNPGTSGEKTSDSKKDKSEFIRLRVIGQVSTIARITES